MSFASILGATMRLAAPTLLVALGGMFCLKIDLFNLGLEGFMLLGSFAAIAGTYMSGSIWVGLLAALATGVLFMLIYGFFSLELGVDPVVGGIAVVSIAAGVTRFLLPAMFGQTGRLELFSSVVLRTYSIPLLSGIPIVGGVFANHSLIVYFAMLCPFLLHYLFYRTPYGLALRATGTSDEVAAAAGVNTRRVKYSALVLAGLLCGLGGAQLSLAANMFNVGMSNGRGYTAIAALILSKARPIPTFLACLLFGVAEALVISLSGEGMPAQFLSMLPYVLAIAVAVLPRVLGAVRHRVRLSHFNRSHDFGSQQGV